MWRKTTEADRHITQVLYGGDVPMRIQQEIVLGVGGVRALRAAGFSPTVWHINEGHPAFMLVERTAELTTRGLPFRRGAGGGGRLLGVYHSYASRRRP